MPSFRKSANAFYQKSLDNSLASVKAYRQSISRNA